MATADDVRALALQLPGSYQVEVRGVEKFRVKQLVYLAFSGDDEILGVAFPKDEREGVIAAEPERFLWPRKSDLRYNWIHLRLAAFDVVEVRELVVDGWRMCVPKRVAAALEPQLPALLRDGALVEKDLPT
jgi:hypothetical protein